MSFIVSTAPTVEPVTLEEAKLHLRADGTDQDALIAALIQTAREHIERICERALMPQKWKLLLDAFPACNGGLIQLPGGLVSSLVSFKYFDTAGVEQTLVANTGYQADLLSQPARLLPPISGVWPTSQLDRLNAVVVEYSVGYAKASLVPAPLKAALLLIVGDLYENREASIVGSIYTETPAVKALLWPYKRTIP